MQMYVFKQVVSDTARTNRRLLKLVLTTHHAFLVFPCPYPVSLPLLSLLNLAALAIYYFPKGRNFPHVRPGRAHGIRLLQRQGQAGGGPGYARDREKGIARLL